MHIDNQARKEFDMQRLVTSDEILDTVSYTMTGSLDDYCCTNYLTPQKYPFFVCSVCVTDPFLEIFSLKRKTLPT